MESPNRSYPKILQNSGVTCLILMQVRVFSFPMKMPLKKEKKKEMDTSVQEGGIPRPGGKK